MKTTLQKVRRFHSRSHAGAPNNGNEQRQDAVKNAVDDYLSHPDWQPSTKPAPAGRQ
jgi:hypothetical protein